MPKRGVDDCDSKNGDHDEAAEGGGDLLSKALKHCWSDDFLDVFRAYFRTHAHKFEVMAEGKTEEHSLEYQELFNEYLLIFEGKLEEFIDRQGSTIGEFYTVIRDHQGSTDPKVQLFITCLLASADYDSFFNVMKKEGQKSLRQKCLENKSKPTAVAEGKDSGQRGGGEGKEQEARRHSGDDERTYK